MKELLTLGILAAVCLTIIVVVLLNDHERERREHLRKIVWGNLDSALEGGQFAEDGALRWLTIAELANDLTIYAEDCSGYLESELVPHVQSWAHERRRQLAEQ